MLRGLTLTLLVCTAISLTTGQTFQYSRGWTNGKRTETSPLASIFDYNKSQSGGSSQNNRLNNLQTRCADLHQWNMLLRRTNEDEEMCQVPCDFLDVLRQCLRGQDKAAATVLLGSSGYRSRSLAPALETSSNSLFSY